MGDCKPPKLTLGEDKGVSTRIWRKKFDSWCLLKTGWRDTTKDVTDDAHWVTAKAKREIAAFYLALPDDVLNVFDTTTLQQMSVAEKTQPWSYLDKLESQFAGQDDVMPQRLAFFTCTQGPKESMTDFETRIRTIARKTRYVEMRNPLQELMRDRLCTGVYNKDLRELLLHHYKDDGQTPFTFDEQINKAKSWEAAHNTNISIMQSTSKLEENVNYTSSSTHRNSRDTRKYQYHTNANSKDNRNCRWCGGARHSRKECPGARPGSFCTNCYMTENHLAVACMSPKDKFKPSFDAKRHKPKPREQMVNKTAHATALTDSDSDDDFVVHSFQAYAIHEMSAAADKYFTWLPVTCHTGKTAKILMQVDSAATCNTLPSSIYDQIARPNRMLPSRAKIVPYSGKPIRPLGKILLACEGNTHFETLEFQVIDCKDIPNKPALLSGKDSERLGLIKFHKSKVFVSETINVQQPKCPSA